MCVMTSLSKCTLLFALFFVCKIILALYKLYKVLSECLCVCLCVCCSKLSQENRVDSPIPILPLPTPDAETERLIKMKDEEVSLESLIIN